MCEPTKLQHCVLVGVELVERLRLISLNKKEFIHYNESILSEFPLATKRKKVTNLMGSHDGGEDRVLGPAQQQLLGPDKPKQAATCTHMRIEDRQNY